MPRCRILVALAVGASWLPVSVAGAEATCEVPTIQALIASEAAVGRPVLRAPSEMALSNVYSLIEQATSPPFAYAEAGPQFTGVFEAIAPPGSPPPPRAVAAFPAEDVPDLDEEDWGGRSTTSVTATTASASSVVDGGAVDLGGVTAEAARSWTATDVSCDVITVVAGWSASGVVLAPGIAIGQIGQEVTLVVSPEGSSADVAVTITDVAGTPLPVIDGNQLAALTGPIRDNGGPTIRVATVDAEATAAGATASGGGFDFLLTDPATGQGAGVRIGSIEASVDVLGAVPTDGRRPAPPVEAAPAGSVPLPTQPVRVAFGDPPAPAPVAQRFTQPVSSEQVLTAITVTSRSWAVPATLGAMAATAGVAYALARALRGRFPTLDWVLVRLDRRTGRFRAAYLRW